MSKDESLKNWHAKAIVELMALVRYHIEQMELEPCIACPDECFSKCVQASRKAGYDQAMADMKANLPGLPESA